MYAFNIKCFISRTVNDKRTADVNMRLLVHSIMDDFDKDHTFTGLVVPSGYTMINVFALPTTWGYSGHDDEYRAAEITILCRVLVDINTIT